MEPVTDPWAAGELKRQAREIFIRSALVAIAGTGLVLLLPASAS